MDHINVKNLTEYDYEEAINTYDNDLQDYLKEVELEERRVKISACLVLIRNLLNKTPNKISDTVANSKLDKLKTFDKIYAETLSYCINNIEEDVCDKILDEKNLYIIDDLSSNRYLKFDAKRFLIIGPEPFLTEEENVLMKEIQEISDKPDFETPPQSVTQEELASTDFSIYKGRGYYISIGLIIGFLVSTAYFMRK